jgi:hypothetical protein
MRRCEIRIRRSLQEACRRSVKAGRRPAESWLPSATTILLLR